MRTPRLLRGARAVFLFMLGRLLLFNWQQAARVFAAEATGRAVSGDGHAQFIVHTAEYRDVHYAPGIYQLGPNGFFETVSSALWLVEFYSPRCRHCLHFRPFVNMLRRNTMQMSRDGVFQMGIVDCVAESKFCLDMNIEEFPTVRLYYNKAQAFDKYTDELLYDPFFAFVDKFVHLRWAQAIKESKIDTSETTATTSGDETQTQSTLGKTLTAPVKHVADDDKVGHSDVDRDIGKDPQKEDAKGSWLHSMITSEVQKYRDNQDPAAAGHLVVFGDEEFQNIAVILDPEEELERYHKHDATPPKHSVWLLFVVPDELMESSGVAGGAEKLQGLMEHVAERLIGKIVVGLVEGRKSSGLVQHLLGNGFKLDVRTLQVVVINGFGQKMVYQGPLSEEAILSWARAVTRAEVAVVDGFKDSQSPALAAAEAGDVDVAVVLSINPDDPANLQTASVHRLLSAILLLLHPPSYRVYIAARNRRNHRTRLVLVRRGFPVHREFVPLLEPNTNIVRVLMFLIANRYPLLPEFDEITAGDIVPPKNSSQILLMAAIDPYTVVDEMNVLEEVALELDREHVQVCWINGLRWSSYLRRAFAYKLVPRSGLPALIFIDSKESSFYRSWVRSDKNNKNAIMPIAFTKVDISEAIKYITAHRYDDDEYIAYQVDKPEFEGKRLLRELYLGAPVLAERVDTVFGIGAHTTGLLALFFGILTVMIAILYHIRRWRRSQAAEYAKVQ